MDTPSNNPNFKPTDWKNEEKTAYILLGWWEESMKKRVETVAKQIEENLDKNLNKKVIITGYEFEIEKIKGFLKEVLTEEKYNKIEIEEVLSYDTFTNISKIKEKTDLFDKYDKFVISTSASHSRRVDMIFERLFEKSDSQKNEFSNKDSDKKFVIEFIKSGEPEARYARLAESIYRNVNPKLLQYASIATRPSSFVKWYLIPLIKKNKGDRSVKRYLWDCTFWYNENNANRYAT